MHLRMSFIKLSIHHETQQNVTAIQKDTFNILSIDDLRHSPTSVLFLSLVRGSSVHQGAAIFWQLIEMSRLSGDFYTELYRAVHRALSAIWNNGVSTFQGELYTGSIGVAGLVTRYVLPRKYCIIK